MKKAVQLNESDQNSNLLELSYEEMKKNISKLKHT